MRGCSSFRYIWRRDSWDLRSPSDIENREQQCGLQRTRISYLSWSDLSTLVRRRWVNPLEPHNTVYFSVLTEHLHSWLAMDQVGSMYFLLSLLLGGEGGGGLSKWILWLPYCTSEYLGVKQRIWSMECLVALKYFNILSYYSLRWEGQ